MLCKFTTKQKLQLLIYIPCAETVSNIQPVPSAELEREVKDDLSLSF